MKVRDPIQIKRLMALEGISVRELARAAGWKSHSYLVRILNGEFKTVQPDPARKIAERLGVDVDRIFLTEVTGEGGQTEPRGSAA